MKVILVRARATDSAIYKLAESLSKNGIDVKLLVWDRQNDIKRNMDKSYKFEKFNLRAPYDKWTIYFYLPFWWIFEFFYLLKNDYDVIHACDIDTQWPAILAKLIKRKKLFYTIFDFYANCIPEKRPYVITNILRSIIGTIEKFGIGFADVLFLADECRYDEVKGAKINKLVYIYNSPPDRFTGSHNSDSAVKNELVIFYAGAMHQYRGIEYMIEAIKDLDGVKLILAGPESDVARFRDQIAKSNDQIQYIGWLPTYDDVLEKTSEADILFRFNDPQILKSKYESPNKLFEAMMCGKPIIINSEIAASKIVKEENCGIAVPYGNINAIQDAILQMRDNPDLRHQLGLNGRAAYEKKYSWKIMEHRLQKVYHME